MADDLTAGDRYVIIRRAVRDALWDVLGDLFTILIATVLVLLGVQLAGISLAGGFGPPELAGAAVGLALLGLAGYMIWRAFYR